MNGISSYSSDVTDVIAKKTLQMSQETAEFGSNIQKFFSSKSVLLTGGTGFLGRTILEKLLRSCPDVDKIYMLVRTKANMKPADRIKELFEDILFTRLKKENPDAYRKVVAVSSEIGEVNLALSEKDRTMLINNVSIIIHSAATVRFDEPLSVAGCINVRGTVELFKLAKECKNLHAFTHISSTFCHCREAETFEQFYDPPIDYKDLLEILKLKEDFIETLEPKILNGLPNTYVFTKAVAEDAVRQLSVGLPVTIVRPCIVISTSQEPMPGWTDRKYPPGFIFSGSAIGFIRVQLIENDANADVVPVDMTANSIIGATYDTAHRFQKGLLKDVSIYNFSNYDTNPMTWKNLINMSKERAVKIPSMKCLWYYSDCRTNSMTVFKFYDFFLHLIPAITLDCFRYLTGDKPVYLRTYKKLHKSIDVLAYFVCRKWKFRSVEMQRMWNRQSQADKTIFPFDMSQLVWDDFVESQNRGLRVYILKDDMSTLPQARIRYARMKIIHLTLTTVAKTLLVILIFKLLQTLFQFNL